MGDLVAGYDKKVIKLAHVSGFEEYISGMDFVLEQILSGHNISVHGLPSSLNDKYKYSVELTKELNAKKEFSVTISRFELDADGNFDFEKKEKCIELSGVALERENRIFLLTSCIVHNNNTFLDAMPLANYFKNVDEPLSLGINAFNSLPDGYDNDTRGNLLFRLGCDIGGAKYKI